MAKVLIVSNEPDVREAVGLHLRREGHDVVSASDGDAGLELYRWHRPDLVVLDLILPGLSGLEVYCRIRFERRVPLILLIPGGEGEEIVLGTGAYDDDYVVKPSSPRKLAARVQAMLRRMSEVPRDPVGGREIFFGDLRLDPNTRETMIRDELVPLTAREFDLLYHLASHPGQVFNRDQLLKAVWGYAFAAGTSTITVHIRRLREKIEDDPANPRYLQTVWGVGYRFDR